MLLFYGGKGGVGKTTCAAARALSEAGAGSSTLVISTDPAHSLGDALGVRLTARPRRVAPRLDAAELDAPRALGRWIGAHRTALADALERGTWLGRSDAEMLLDLPVPGVDELVGLLEIVRLAARYDAVVVDTAPTGHALRLMAAPATVAALAELLETLQADHRFIRERFARRSAAAGADAADRVIALMAAQADETARTLRDPKRSVFHWVTLPERLSMAESADGIAALTAEGIEVRQVVVNRLLPDGAACPICDPRRAEERRVLREIAASLPSGRELRIVPATMREPRGRPALAAIGRELSRPHVARSAKAFALQQRRPVSLEREGLSRAADDPAPDGLSRALAAVRGAELIFVGGKGGVGKTTVAAAIAMQLARETDDRSVLLLSTDPAHSVADVLDCALDDEPRQVGGAPANLVARELNAPAAFERTRRSIRDAVGEVASGAGSGLSAAGPSGVDGIDRLLSLAPPGIDELFGMLTVVEARASHGVVVVDTAPTGHALRLLAMPETAREWVQALLRLLLKYRELVRPGALAAELVDLSKSIRELDSVLRDSRRTRFLVVTRAAAVPRAETERLLRRLRSLSLATTAIIVNGRTLTPGACDWCRAVAAAERRELAALSRPRGCVIIQAPLIAPPPRGTVALDRWARSWVAETRRLSSSAGL